VPVGLPAILYLGTAIFHEPFAFPCGLETSRDLRIIVVCDSGPSLCFLIKALAFVSRTSIRHAMLPNRSSRGESGLELSEGLVEC
jgi:hypothetical protein